MPFRVFTDACSNLPHELLERFDIHVLPCAYVMDGVTVPYEGDISGFDGHAYYDALRKGAKVTTSLLNTFTFSQAFRPMLENGMDIVYIGLSSGISGTMQAAGIASEELLEEFPDRVIRTVDSMGAGFGTGLLACRAGELLQEGKTANEAADILEQDVKNLCEYFIVDDLMFLHRTGRVSGAAALIGNALHIMPMLRGDETGHIVASGKFIGRKNAMQALIKQYRQKVVDPSSQRIAITHGDCPEEAEKLATLVRNIAEPKELFICPHEPFTGAHVGPGMLALFFFGDGR